MTERNEIIQSPDPIPLKDLNSFPLHASCHFGLFSPIFLIHIFRWILKCKDGTMVIKSANRVQISLKTVSICFTFNTLRNRMNLAHFCLSLIIILSWPWFYQWHFTMIDASILQVFYSVSGAIITRRDKWLPLRLLNNLSHKQYLQSDVSQGK